MDLHILVGSALVIAAILSTRFTQRFGVPALVLLVALGILAGSSGPGGTASALPHPAELDMTGATS